MSQRALNQNQFQRQLGPLFHGTTEGAADRILQTGFEPGKDASRGAVWLTPHEHQAQTYAASRAKREGAKPAVLRVESVEGKPSDYMNFEMSRSSGADFSDFGHEVAVHNTKAIKGVRRVS